MESSNNAFKYLTALFAITTIVFAVLYFTKETSISENYGDISQNAVDCRDGLENWQRKYGGATTATEAARQDLQNVLKSCANLFEDSQQVVE
jgi:hypothetical protein